jgi:hypothetical protein
LSGDPLGTVSPDARSFLMAATTLFSSRVIAAFATRSRWSAETYEIAPCRRACVAFSGVTPNSSRARLVSNWRALIAGVDFVMRCASFRTYRRAFGDRPSLTFCSGLSRLKSENDAVSRSHAFASQCAQIGQMQAPPRGFLQRQMVWRSWSQFLVDLLIPRLQKSRVENSLMKPNKDF